MNKVNSDAPKKERVNKNHTQGRKREGSRRWLFLVVDVLLLAAIVTAVIFVISLLTPWSIFGGDQGEIRSLTYTVEIAGVDQEQLTALQKGDTVTDRRTGEVIGVVTAINNRDYEVYSEHPELKPGVNGEDYYEVVKEQYPGSGLQTVTVTIQVDATYQRGVGYRVGDTRIAAGRELELIFRNYTDTGVCIGLSEK